MEILDIGLRRRDETFFNSLPNGHFGKNRTTTWQSMHTAPTLSEHDFI